jgi:hypothetical protein
MNRLAELLIVVALSMVATTARAEDWISIAANNDSFYFFDLDSVKPDKSRSGENVKLWSMTKARDAEKALGVVIKTKTLRRYDCSNETLAQLATVSYSRNDKVVSSDFNEYAPTAVVPGSVGEFLLRNACSEDERAKSIRAVAEVEEYLAAVKAFLADGKETNASKANQPRPSKPGKKPSVTQPN